MKMPRLYTGTDQKSHFEDIELEFGGEGHASRVLGSEPHFFMTVPLLD